MDLSLAHSPILLFAIAIVAAAFTWWSYGKMVPRPHGWRRAALGSLRFLAMGTLLLLLFQPILQRISTQLEDPVLAILLDDSRSIVATDTTEAAAALQPQLREALRALDADARFFRFAGDVQPFEGDSLAFDGARTDISRGLEEVARRLAHTNLRGVVLVTDGRYNTGRNPLYVSERYAVPIYTVTVGDTTEPRDVRIAEVITNDIAYTGVELPVRVSVQSRGFEGQRGTVAISEGGRVMDSQPLTIPPDGRQASVDLAITPDEEGLRRYTVSVTRFDGEATHANNASSLLLRVLSAQRRVLLLAGAPGPDLSFLRQTLEIDPDLDIVARTPRPDGSYYEGPLPTNLAEFDLAILVGFPGRSTPTAHTQAVAAAARQGLPLLFTLTRQTDLARLADGLADVLPVRPEAVRGGFIEAQIRVSSAGATHPVLYGSGVPVEALGSLPPTLVNESRWRAAPDTDVLATVRVRGTDLPDPLLAVQRRGSHRTAALLAAGTWRWRNLPPDLQHLAPFYEGLVRNLVSWLTAHEDDRPVRVRPVQNDFDITEPVRFTGQVYDEAFQPVSDADVRVTIRAPDGSELPFPMRPLGSGRFEAETTTLPEGDYAYHARAERGGALLGEDSGQFAVGAIDIEFRHLTADAALMREIALRSGGQSFFADDRAGLVGALSERLEARPVATASEVELWRLAPLLFVLVGLLSAEWVMRKRLGMV